METSEQFYCVCCGKLLENGQADTLFRTGFFRIVHPLGACQTCTKEEHQAPASKHERQSEPEQDWTIEPIVRSCETYRSA